MRICTKIRSLFTPERRERNFANGSLPSSSYFPLFVCRFPETSSTLALFSFYSSLSCFFRGLALSSLLSWRVLFIRATRPGWDSPYVLEWITLFFFRFLLRRPGTLVIALAPGVIARKRGCYCFDKVSWSFFLLFSSVFRIQSPGNSLMRL